MNFVPRPTHKLSDFEVCELWNKLEAQGLHIEGTDAKDQPVLEKRHKLDDYFEFKKYIVLTDPILDPTFEATCKGYKADWEAHKPNIIDTAKTFTVKPKDK